nr:hypothetical protein [Actinomycetota bacterium]
RAARRAAGAVVAGALAVAPVAPAVAAPGPHGRVGLPDALVAPAAGARALGGRGTLAFVSLGRLLVLDGRTGRLVAVTGSDETASSPEYSPGGRWLAYSTRPAGRPAPGGRPAELVATADGTRPHRVPGATGGSWLPDGRLVAGRYLWRVGPSGAPERVGRVPSGLVAWAPDGSAYAFVESTLPAGLARAASGVERLEVARTLSGPRTTWYETRVSYSPSGGFTGEFVYSATVRSRGRGVLFTLDPYRSASLAADGLPLELLSRPGARPERLGVTVRGAVAVSPRGPSVAFVDGPGRDAWGSKHVETCGGSPARCSPVRSPAGELTMDPAWSPTGRSLAFVVAAPGTASGFSPSDLDRWYATRRLWVAAAGGAAHALAGTAGAAAPLWSADGRELLYVSGDALWVRRVAGGASERVAGPLFAPGSWPSFDGSVDWSAQFAWSS